MDRLSKKRLRGPSIISRPIQLLEYTDPEHAGYRSIRFCYFSPGGRFQRGPMMLGEDEIAGLRAALQETPQLRALLKKLVD